MKAVLITGINGFIGRKIAAALLARGYAVTGVDRAQASAVADASYIRADITDAAAMGDIFAEQAFDAVIHLAALVHKKDGGGSQAEYDRVNAQASAKIFELAAHYGVSCVLYASTIEVYGEPSVPIVDEQTPCAPVSRYARSKYAAENALQGIAGRFKRCAVIRFAPVYAPDFRLNLDKRFYLPMGGAAFYFKSGGYSFHFCAVENITGFVCGFLEGNGNGGVYIVSDREPVRANEFIRMEKEHNGLKRAVRLPYGPAYAAVAALEGVSRIASRADPFFSRYNFKKMFRSTVFSSEKARLEVAPMPYDIRTLYGRETPG